MMDCNNQCKKCMNSNLIMTPFPDKEGKKSLLAKCNIGQIRFGKEECEDYDDGSDNEDYPNDL